MSAQIALFSVDEYTPTVNYAKVERLLNQSRQLRDQLAQVLQSEQNRPHTHRPAAAAQIFTPLMEPPPQEELWVLTLNTRNAVTGLHTIYRGSVNSSQVRVAEVFRPAIVANAPALIIAHNHPSGDPTPSPDDVAITRALVEAGKLLDIQILDHLVIGCARFISLKERGKGF